MLKLLHITLTALLSELRGFSLIQVQSWYMHENFAIRNDESNSEQFWKCLSAVFHFAYKTSKSEVVTYFIPLCYINGVLKYLVLLLETAFCCTPDCEISPLLFPSYPMFAQLSLGPK